MSAGLATVRSNWTSFRRSVPPWGWGVFWIGLAVLYPYITDSVDLPIIGDCAHVLEDLLRAWRHSSANPDKKALDAWKARRVLAWTPRGDREAVVATAESLLALGLVD